MELKINNKKVKPKSIFLGPQMIKPKKNPFTITQIIVAKKVKVDKKKEKEEVKKEIEKEIKEPELVYEKEPDFESHLKEKSVEEKKENEFVDE